MLRTILLITISFSSLAQSNCPIGYETKNVKCGGVISPKCVPENYTCKLCWAVANPPCEGKLSGGLSFYSSYNFALEKAEAEKAKKNTCPLWYNNQVYQIYLDDSKLCSGSVNSSTFNSSLFDKMNKSIKDLRNKLIQLKQAYDDFPVVDRAEAGLIGYLEFIERAYDAAQIAYSKALEYQKQPMKELEDALNSSINHLNMQYIDASSKIVHIQTYNIKKTESKYANKPAQQYNYQSQQDVKKQQQLDQIDLDLADLKRKQETIKVNTPENEKALTDLISTIAGNSYDKNYEAERQKRENENIERKKKAQKEEAEREAKRKEDQKQQNLLYQQQLIELQKQKQDQTKNINEWKAKSSNLMNTETLKESIKFKKPSDITNNNLKSIYYVIWNFSKTNEVIVSDPVEIKKSSDGDWMLMKDFKKQIEEKTKLKINSTPDGIPTDDSELLYILGYFENISLAENARRELINSAKQNGNVIVELQDIKSNETTPLKNDKSFWDE